MSVSSFKGQFGDLVRDNRFTISGNAAPPKPDLIITAQVPAVSVATLEHRDTHSAPWKIPYDSILSEATLTFRDDNNMTNRRFYERWYMKIVSTDGFGYYNTFAEPYDLRIEQLNRDDSLAYWWELYEVYPISLSEIAFDQSSQNSFTTFSVTLAYHDADWIGS